MHKTVVVFARRNIAETRSCVPLSEHVFNTGKTRTSTVIGCAVNFSSPFRWWRGCCCGRRRSGQSCCTGRLQAGEMCRRGATGACACAWCVVLQQLGQERNMVQRGNRHGSEMNARERCWQLCYTNSSFHVANHGEDREKLMVEQHDETVSQVREHCGARCMPHEAARRKTQNKNSYLAHAACGTFSKKQGRNGETVSDGFRLETSEAYISCRFNQGTCISVIPGGYCSNVIW